LQSLIKLNTTNQTAEIMSCDADCR